LEEQKFRELSIADKRKIMDDTNVFFHSANNRITYLGKKANIEEAK
jgi:hypothetical protein